MLTYVILNTDLQKRFYVLHWIAWTNALVGVLMVLIAHGHYTIDVLIAYYITTRLFWVYHTLANNCFLLKVIYYIHFRSSVLRFYFIFLMKHPPLRYPFLKNLNIGKSKRTTSFAV